MPAQLKGELLCLKSLLSMGVKYSIPGAILLSKLMFIWRLAQWVERQHRRAHRQVHLKHMSCVMGMYATAAKVFARLSGTSTRNSQQPFWASS